jgi:uncharacterized protein YjeT (DUF2065 family)
MNWSDLFAAFALYLVMEGIVPFLKPAAMKQLMQRLAQLSENHVRIWGLVSMATGVVLLFLVRG